MDYNKTKDPIISFTDLIGQRYISKTKAIQILDISAPTLDKRLGDGGWRPGEVALMEKFLREHSEKFNF